MNIDNLKRLVRDTTLIQIVLNIAGRDLVVDGDIGPKTIRAYNIVGWHTFEYILNEIMNKQKFDVPDYAYEAFKEIGVKEIQGDGSNPEVEKYHSVAGLSWAKDDIPWCGSFIAYCMSKANIDFIEVKNPASSLSWFKFGKKVDMPYYGALCIKTRKGGGHITMSIGISEDRRYFYGLGGNQDDKVCIHKYPISIFKGFRLPYNTKPITVIKDIEYARKGIRES